MGIICKISLKTKKKLEYIEIVVKKSAEPVFYHGGRYAPYNKGGGHSIKE